MEKKFKDKVVLITGGSSGIGEATAMAFARNGASIIIADINENKETINIIKNLGGDAIFVKCDVSKVDDIKTLIQKSISTFGHLDYAFNNAGIEGLNASTHECTEDNFDKVISINLKGIWACMKYEIPEMLKQGNGVIVNCASIAGMVGFQGSPAYVASKHGIIGLTKTAALEYAQKGIRINAVCPGVIKTPMITRATGNKQEVEDQYAKQEPIGRLGQPEEISSAVLWLCSDEASFVTGHSMVIDGGWTAQ